jgi:hypothetical protein
MLIMKRLQWIPGLRMVTPILSGTPFDQGSCPGRAEIGMWIKSALNGSAQDRPESSRRPGEPIMPASALALSALYLAIGALFAGRCRFANARAGWRGQAAVALAAIIMALIWPMSAWYAARHRWAAPRHYR